MMYMSERGTAERRRAWPASAWRRWPLAIVAIFYLGVLPTQVLNVAAASISTIF